MKKDKLLKYLMISNSDEYFNKFRLMEVGIVDKDINKEIIEKLIEKGKIDSNLIENLNQLNLELRRNYRGKFKFGLIFDEKSKTLDEIIEDPRKRNNIRKKFKNFINEVSKIKEKAELSK